MAAVYRRTSHSAAYKLQPIKKAHHHCVSDTVALSEQATAILLTVGKGKAKYCNFKIFWQ